MFEGGVIIAYDVREGCVYSIGNLGRASTVGMRVSLYVGRRVRCVVNQKTRRRICNGQVTSHQLLHER